MKSYSRVEELPPPPLPSSGKRPYSMVRCSLQLIMDKSEVGIVQDIPCTFIFNWSCDSSWLMSHQSTNIFHEISLKALTSGGLLQRNILENVLITICKSNQINNIINFYRIQFLIKSIDGKMLPSIKNGQEWCGYCAGYSLHFHIQLKLWLMTHESTNIFHEISLKALTSGGQLQKYSWKCVDYNMQIKSNQ